MRYGLTAAVAVIGVVIAPRAFENGRLYSVMLVAMIVSTRVIVVAPRRFEMRNATLGWRWLWYLLLGQIALLAIAFALALSPRGSVPGAWAALAVAAGIEIFALRREPGEHVRAGTLVPWLRYIPSNETEELASERPAPATNAFKSALADVYAEIPTVVRAYLATARSDDGRDRRVLGLRFAFAWVDDDAVIAAEQLFRYMVGPGESLEIYPLDDRSERRVRTVAQPFYERAARPRSSSTSCGA